MFTVQASSRDFVIRLLSNGSQDAEFGTGGVVELSRFRLTDGGLFFDEERILLGGVVRVPESTIPGTGFIRLSPAGLLDRTFGSSGFTVAPETENVVNDTVVFARGDDGKLVVATQSADASQSSSRLRVIRLFANGALDFSFGVGGMREYSSPSGTTFVPIFVSVDSAGGITVGTFIGPERTITLVRLLTDGSIDTRFGLPQTPGFARLDSDVLIGHALARLVDGRFIALTGGTETSPGVVRKVLYYSSAGLLDSTSGDQGRSVPVESVKITSEGHPHVAQPDGGILVVGTHNPDGQPTSLRLIRLQAGPSITTSARGLLTTTESGTTATFDIRLSSKPTADVTISVTSSDTTEGTVSTSSLTFTPDNWSTAQTVTITGVDDSLFDTDQRYRINLGPATSTDANYNGKTIPPVEVRNRDDETLRFFRSFNPQANFHFFTTSVSEFQGSSPTATTTNRPAAAGSRSRRRKPPASRSSSASTTFKRASTTTPPALPSVMPYWPSTPPQGDPNFGRVGWRFEGSPGFIADTQQSGTSQVFRLYNRTSGTHLFTENPAVKAAVLQLQGWEEHAPLGFAFLVDDAAPTTPAPPPTPVLLESSSVSSVMAGSPSGNPASLVATPSGSRSLPAAVSSALETLAEGPVEVVEDGPLDVDTLDTYLASLTGELVGTLLG